MKKLLLFCLLLVLFSFCSPLYASTLNCDYDTTTLACTTTETETGEVVSGLNLIAGSLIIGFSIFIFLLGVMQYKHFFD